MCRMRAVLAGRGRLRTLPIVDLVSLLALIGVAGFMVWTFRVWRAKIVIGAILGCIVVMEARRLIRSWRSGEYRYRGGIEQPRDLNPRPSRSPRPPSAYSSRAAA